MRHLRFVFSPALSIAVALAGGAATLAACVGDVPARGNGDAGIDATSSAPGVDAAADSASPAPVNDAGGIDDVSDAGNVEDAGDAPADASTVGTCDPHGVFTEIAPVDGITSAIRDEGITLSQDGRTAIVARGGGDAGTNWNLYASTRARDGDTFPAATPLAPFAHADRHEAFPTLSRDGLWLFYVSGTITDASTWDIYLSTREKLDAAFGEGQPLSGPNDPDAADSAGPNDPNAAEWAPAITPDRATLFFVSDRGGSSGIYQAARTGETTFGSAQSILALAPHSHPVLSSDGLQIYVSGRRITGDKNSDFEIFRAERASTTQSFGNPERVEELNSAFDEAPGWLSPDSCELYFQRDRVATVTAGFDYYIARRAKK